MLRWSTLADIPEVWGRSVVTVGVFDGVHRGHQHLIGRARALADQRRLPLVVVTFDPNPIEVIRPGSHLGELTTMARRLELLEEVAADAVLVLAFTSELSQVPAEDFVSDYLVTGLHAAAVVVGSNFRYGHRAAGDVELLGKLGERHGFDVDGVELLADGGSAVSSTYIRSLITGGDVAAAAAALSRPHRVEGIVVEGDKRGRALGFPTANLEPTRHAVIPADGIYAGWLLVKRAPLPAAISIGTNPTFDGTARRVEAHALDRDDLDLYGEAVSIDFAERLRDTLRFDSVAALVNQMADDVARCRDILAGMTRVWHERPPQA